MAHRLDGNRDFLLGVSVGAPGKALRLAGHSGAATAAEMKPVIARIWRLHDEPSVRDFLAGL